MISQNREEDTAGERKSRICIRPFIELLELFFGGYWRCCWLFIGFSILDIRLTLMTQRWSGQPSYKNIPAFLNRYLCSFKAGFKLKQIAKHSLISGGARLWIIISCAGFCNFVLQVASPSANW